MDITQRLMKVCGAVVIGIFSIFAMTGSSVIDDESYEDSTETREVGIALSDKARQVCRDAGMTNEKIEQNKSRCLDIYWSPERMRQASSGPPGDLPPFDPPSSIERFQHLFSDMSYSYGVSDQSGKLFMTDPVSGDDGSCTASSIQSNSRNMIVTAGHCLHGGGPDGEYYIDVKYIPRYDPYVDIRGRYGEYVAIYGEVMPNWELSGKTCSDPKDCADVPISAYDHDVGFAAVIPSSPLIATPLVDRVGGHEVQFSTASLFDTTIIGYPRNLGPGDGGMMPYRCDGLAHNEEYDNHVFLTFDNCPFEKGASGGPWLVDFEDDVTEAKLFSVTSTTDQVGRLRAPYFDSDTETLYDKVEYIMTQQ